MREQQHTRPPFRCEGPQRCVQNILVDQRDNIISLHDVDPADDPGVLFGTYDKFQRANDVLGLEHHLSSDYGLRAVQR